MQRFLSWLQWPYLFILGAFNRDTPLGRIVRIPYAIWACGLSWPAIALQLHKGDRADKNQLAENCWGFCDPLLTWDREGSLNHRSIDYLVEWVRKSEPQRVAKLGSFVILVLAALAIMGWAA